MATKRVTFPLAAEVPGPRGTAWTVSFAVHAAALAIVLGLLQGTPTVPPTTPAPLIYVEPAPAPPAPLGIPAGEVAAPPVVEVPKELLPEPSEPVQPLVKKRQPVRASLPRPAMPPPAVPRGEPLGELGGVMSGVVGGTPGGVVGDLPGGKGDAPIPAERVAHPPVPVEKVVPTYPAMARARGLEGVVLLRAIVDREGCVEDGVTVVESSPTFADAAVAAFRRWRFQPGRNADGTIVRVLVEVPIRFQLR